MTGNHLGGTWQIMGISCPPPGTTGVTQNPSLQAAWQPEPSSALPVSEGSRRPEGHQTKHRPQSVLNVRYTTNPLLGPVFAIFAEEGINHLTLQSKWVLEVFIGQT
jgi:hypothetical protein